MDTTSGAEGEDPGETSTGADDGTGGQDATAPPDLRRRRRRRSAVLIGLLLVAALVAAGAVGVPKWQRHQALQVQAGAYATGHRAFQAGQCTTARPWLAKADRPGLDPSVTAAARSELQACREYLSLPGPNVAPVDRLPELLGYSQRDVPPPLRAAAIRTGQGLIAATAADQLAGDRLCLTFEQLVPTGFVTADQAPTILPALTAACA